MPSVVSFAPDENTQDGGSRVVGFEPDEQPQVVGFEPDFSDVKGGSSSTNDTYWQGVKSRFGEAVRSPMAAIGGAFDPLVKPIRESLQQGGITGSMGPDIAKQAFGRKAGGFVEGLEKDVAPGLVSGENVAITAGMLAAPQSAAFLLPKFGKEGAQQAIAATQAPEGETPEETGRRYAQGVGGAAMALAPIIHGAAGPVREAISRFKEPAAKLDFDAVSRESMGEIKRAPGPEVLETRIEAPAEVKPVPPREATEPTFTAIADGDKFDVSPEKPLAGTTATGSLGEAARPVVERAAEAETRGAEPTAPRAAEAGEGVAPVEGGLPLEQPDLTHRSIRDFQRAAGVPEYEGSRFSRSNQGIRDAVVGNEAALVERGRKAKVGEALSDEVQYALKKHTDDLVRSGGDQAEIQQNYKILSESNSAKGRQLQALQTAIDNVDHTDPAAVVGLAQKATNGKLSIQAQMDLADMSRKAGKMKEASADVINKRAGAALARLEGMGEQIKRLTIKDVLGCR